MKRASESAVKRKSCGSICIAPHRGAIRQELRRRELEDFALQHHRLLWSCLTELEEGNLGSVRLEAISRGDDRGDELADLDLPRLLTDQLLLENSALVTRLTPLLEPGELQKVALSRPMEQLRGTAAMLERQKSTSAVGTCLRPGRQRLQTLERCIALLIDEEREQQQPQSVDMEQRIQAMFDDLNAEALRLQELYWGERRHILHLTGSVALVMATAWPWRQRQSHRTPESLMGIFERFLSLGSPWRSSPVSPSVQRFRPCRGDRLLDAAGIHLLIALLIWGMIYPMMLAVDFSAIGGLSRQPRGLIITVAVNWLIKPLTMTALAWLFIRGLFSAWIPAELGDQYVAGMILLGVAPCTAMVFVWSRLSDGDADYTLVQVAVNDLIMVFAFAPIAALLLGVVVLVPWDTLIAAVGLFAVIPLVAGWLTRVF